ncbi:MAG: PAS domain-containing sensor histidine kinase [Ktedonobacteraceae bacterium]|nr:PAS domain-containing sensor histidine kinase [Ktedonobacteraceae bacterium]
MSTHAEEDGLHLIKQETSNSEERRFRALIEHSSDVIMLNNAKGIVTYVSSSITSNLGYMPAEFIGQVFLDFVHPDDVPILQDIAHELQWNGDKSLSTEYRLRRKDGAWRWFEGTGTNLLHDPDVNAFVGNFRAITVRKAAEERLHLLNAVSILLVSSLDHEITLQQIAQLLVPAQADYCRIALVDDHQQVKEITVNHVDPEKNALVQALYEQYKDRSSSTHGLQKLLTTGQPELISIVSQDVLETTRDNPTLFALVGTLSLRSYMGVPLIARGKTIGAMTFSSIQPHRHYTNDDLLFAQEVARRIALALDNVHLYKEAQNAIRLRDEFIATASHELRTPITSLKMYTQVLQKRFARQGDESMNRSLMKMDAQIGKLTLLIEDLLDVSKLELGKVAFRQEAFNLNEVIAEIVEHVQSISTRHTIHIEGKSTLPLWGDKERIGQVLTNLLINAIKYSPHADTVLVHIVQEQAMVIVKVQDFGIGIAKEHQQQIFERFYRVNDPEEKTYPGLGIGLHIAYEIIMRHGGTMYVESEKGKGSSFCFTLPYTSDKTEIA